jgi:CRP/FNR family transcriptional regulator
MDALPPYLIPLLKTARSKQIARGQVLFYSGDLAPNVFIIKSGIIKIYDIDNQGNEKILHLVERPAIIPFAFFSGISTPTRWFYSALTDCELYEIPRLKLLSELQANSALAIYLMNWFSSEMHNVLTRVSSLGKAQVKEKLLAILGYLQANHSTACRGGWWRVEFPVNHQLLADLVGNTRESVTLAMKELHDAHIVRTPRLAVLEIKADKVNE